MFCSIHSADTHGTMFRAILSDHQLDSAITEPGRRLMEKRFLQEGETVRERLAHACVAYAPNMTVANRLAAAVTKGWFMFATPVLTNAGTSRGLPISCFLNYVDDSRQGLADHYTENIFFSTNGGGVGAHWSDVRSAGQVTSRGAQSSGIIPFIKVADSQVRAFKQGYTRRAAYAAYLDVSHPEIMEFLDIRTPTGGDLGRRCLDIHHGVNITDAFMRAVNADSNWDLIDPHSQEVIETVQARDIWGAIIQRRMVNRGGPYLCFVDTMNDYSSYGYYSDLSIRGSNLCTEIALATGPDYSAVCCLSSVNALYYDAWGQG